MTPEQREELERRAIAQQVLEERLFHQDPWYAVEQGWVFTEDEHCDVLKGEDPIRLMPDKDYMKRIAHIVMTQQTGIIMKTRQLMMTWLFCWLMLWDATTKKGRLCVAQGKREEDVLAKGHKGLMGRIRCMRENLPIHLQPKVVEKSKSTEVFENGSTIMCIPQGADVIRSVTASFIYMDELAFHPEGEQAWTAALPTVKGGGRIWGITTPNGQEFCYDQADHRMRWDDWQEWPKVVEGLYGYKNTRDTKLIALHYTADPERRTPEFQTQIRAGYTNINLYRQENELDFSMHEGDPVYGEEFREELHVLKEDYVVNPMMPIYRGWDFGYNGQSVSFFQHNSRGQLIWFDLVFFQRVPLQKVIGEVKKRSLWHMGKYGDKKGKQIIEVPLYDLEGKPIEGARLAKMKDTVTGDVYDYGDPSSEAKNNRGQTDKALLASFGITLRTRPTTGRKYDIVEQVRALLLARSDGCPGLMVSPGPFHEMRTVISGFKGGYIYRSPRPGMAHKLLPHKDGFFDHIFDSAQYAIDWIKPIRPGIAEEVDNLPESAWWKGGEWEDSPWSQDFDRWLRE